MTNEVASGAVTIDDGARWAVFRAGLAIAAVFHLLPNASLAEPSGMLLLGLAATAVLLRPHGRWPLLALAGTVALSFGQEAPVVGNHWLLALLFALAVVLAIPGDPARIGSRALPAIRVVTLVFYAYVAFAKLNPDFLDPAVSCAPYFLEESLRSVHLGWLDLTAHTSVRRLVAFGTLLVESSVPVLLIVRRTRTAAVLLALGFHWVLAVDRTHEFYDFSSVLFAVFLTFLPVAVLDRTLDRLGRWVPSSMVRTGLATVPAFLGVLGAASSNGSVRRETVLNLGWWLWQPLALAVMAAVVLAVRETGVRSGPVSFLPSKRWLLIVPALSVVNGALPYLEVKTSTVWNMYSNLRTAGGHSNHVLVSRTFPLTSPQDDLVEVLGSDDPLLDLYAGTDLRLPVRSVRTYLQEHPATSAVVVIAGERVTIVAGEPIPERLGPPVPEWLQKLFILRSVDVEDPVACQSVYLPAA